MAVLFRVLLFALLIYLIVKMIREFLSPPKQEDSKMSSPGSDRKVSKDVGEYVDFEEINEEKERKKKDNPSASKGSGKTRDYR